MTDENVEEPGTNRMESVRPVTTLAEEGDRIELRRASHLDLRLIAGASFAFVLFAVVMVWVVGAKVPVPSERGAAAGNVPGSSVVSDASTAAARGITEMTSEDRANEWLDECGGGSVGTTGIRVTVVLAPRSDPASRIVRDPSLQGSPTADCLQRRIEGELFDDYAKGDGALLVTIDRNHG